MKIAGIITEYNPFHNGHLYQLKEIKKIINPDYIIIIMSGNFLQRGEPALVNKWIRTEMALKAGVDLVIELPFVFATQDANGFAWGAVKILNLLGIVDYLCFGCETADLNILSPISKFLQNESKEFQEILKQKSKSGYEYPRIRANALLEYHHHQGIKNLENLSLYRLKKILNCPNNILAIEYIKHLLNLKSKIIPLPIKRVGADYHQTEIEGDIASATSIRKEILENLQNSKNNKIFFSSQLKKAIPWFTLQLLEKEFLEGRNPITLKSFDQLILGILRKLTLEEIFQIHGVNEGLESRIKKSVFQAFNIEQLITSIKTKRYTRTKIQRILIHSLTGLKKEDILEINNLSYLYIRILGFSKKGRTLLKILKNKSSLALINNLSKFLSQNILVKNNKILQRMINFDILATDLYVLGYNQEKDRVARQDFKHKIIIL